MFAGGFLDAGVRRSGAVAPGAEAAHRQSGTGKWLAPDQVRRQAEGDPEFAHLVFVQMRQRLNDQSAGNQFLHHVHPVVVRLDHR